MGQAVGAQTTHSAQEGASVQTPDPSGAGRLKKTWKGTLEQQDGHNDESDTQQEQQPHRNAPCGQQGERSGAKGPGGPEEASPPYPSRAYRATAIASVAPAPVTHAVRAAGAAGNDCPQPQRTAQFHETLGALDHDPSQAERPHLSPQCHEPPSRSRGAVGGKTRW